MRQRSRGQHGTATAEDLLPVEIRRRRCERALTREELARRTGYSRQYIGQLEQPSRGIASRPVIAAVDAALEAGGALIDLREAAVAARAERLRRRPDPERESRRRVSDLLDHRRSDTELDYLDRLVADLIAKADRLDPQDVTAQVLDQQNVVDHLLRTPMLPHQQFRLFMLAGHLAGLLAISLLDVDELAGASTCCLEAAVFTELTGHEGLRAWTLAVNSLIDAAARRACDGEQADVVPDEIPDGPAIATLLGRPSGRPAPQGCGPAAAGAPGTPGASPADPPELPSRTASPEPGGLVGTPDPMGTPEAQSTPGESTPEAEGTPGAQGTPSRPGPLSTPEEQLIGTARDPLDEDGASDSLDEMLIAPGGRVTPPRLIALVKGRIARFATASTHRVVPPTGISHAFRPPV